MVKLILFFILVLHNIGTIWAQSPPKVITEPERYYNYSTDSRKFTGIPSIAVTSMNTIWAVWYAGITSGEDANNYIVLGVSHDDGKSWEETLVIDPDGKGPVRAFDPEIWISKDGRLWVFWSQKQGVIDGTDPELWSMSIVSPDSRDFTYTTPKKISAGVMMCKPVILFNGDWLLPVSTWRHTDNSAKVVVSDDQGKSWKERGACNIPVEVRDFDEHMVVERKDRSLWMLVRTKYGIGESVSKDQGKTWSSLKPSNIKHPSSRFFISRLSSGNLLLVKHGPINLKTRRSHLMAFISKNEGESWSKGLLLDERTGISYPDGQQTKAGKIYITYDFSRVDAQQILMTSFSEDNILSPDYDQNIVNIFGNRKVVSKGGR